MQSKYPRITQLALLSLAVMATETRAQIGSGWVQYKPERKIHLVDFTLPTRKGMVAFDWTNHMQLGSNTPCSSYDYDAKTDTETFRLLDKRANRSEIRLQNEYGTGSRQFEGYVTFYPPLNNESLMQVWGSDEGATQLMIRGYAANGGEIRVANRIVHGDDARIATNCYGREIKINVIHLQEDVGNKFIIYADNKKALEFVDDENPANHDGENYHKYGCYGTLNTREAVVKWRAVRNFKDGKAPPEDATPIPVGTNPVKSRPARGKAKPAPAKDAARED